MLEKEYWWPTPVLLSGKSHGGRSLVGYSSWCHKESDRTEWLHFHFSLSCIGEGNGNPLQCSCLENPRDGGAWWAAIYGVARSRTQLKWLSSSSSSSFSILHFVGFFCPQHHRFLFPFCWEGNISSLCSSPKFSKLVVDGFWLQIPHLSRTCHTPHEYSDIS